MRNHRVLRVNQLQMAMFNCFVKCPEGIWLMFIGDHRSSSGMWFQHWNTGAAPASLWYFTYLHIWYDIWNIHCYVWIILDSKPLTGPSLLSSNSSSYIILTMLPPFSPSVFHMFSQWNGPFFVVNFPMFLGPTLMPCPGGLRIAPWRPAGLTRLWRRRVSAAKSRELRCEGCDGGPRRMWSRPHGAWPWTCTPIFPGSSFFWQAVCAYLGRTDQVICPARKI